MFRLGCGLVLLTLLSTVAAAADPPAAAEREALEKKFCESLSGVQFVGKFTDDTKNGATSEEKYTIESVSKVAGNVFLFKARIQYNGKDATLPLPLPVEFAGDTPVITLNKFPVPGFGTFSARVVIADGKYAGTWDGADHGGHLFGKIVKAPAEEKKAEKK